MAHGDFLPMILRKLNPTFENGTIGLVFS